MAELFFDQEADATLSRLEADPALRTLWERIEAVLAQLEADSGDRAVRRVRFRTPALWCVPVVAADEEWAILWEPHPSEDDAVIVQYVGPAGFT